MVRNIICKGIDGKTVEINIEQEKFVKDIKYLYLERTGGSGTEKSVCVVYCNCILNDEQSISFYKFENGDSFSIGKIEDYLREDWLVVECFVAGVDGDLSHMLAEETEKVHSLVGRMNELILNFYCYQVWTVEGRSLSYEDMVGEARGTSGSIRIIFGVDESNKGRHSISVEARDQYVLDQYFRICNWTYWIDIYDEKLSMRKQTMNFAQKLLSGVKEDERLSDKLLDKKESFINSPLLFVTTMTNRIFDICKQYWRNTFEKSEWIYCDEVVDHFQLTLNVSLIDYMRLRRANRHNVDKSMKDILFDAGEYLMDTNLDILHLTKTLNDEFLIRSRHESQIEDIIDNMSKEYILVNINNRGSTEQIRIHKGIQTMRSVKREISLRTGVAECKLHIIKCGSEGEVSEEDTVDLSRYQSASQFMIQVIHDDANIVKLELIGSGSYGLVFLCRNTEYNNVFALKQPWKENLSREINIMHQTTFPKMYETDLYLIDRKICLGMKYYSGGSLRSYLKEKQCLSEKEILQIAHQILLQIENLHKHGIIHGDIKPDNIMFDDQHNPILIDFGLSKCSDNNSDQKYKSYTFGAMRYRAPEVFVPEFYCNKIDIWSFGATVIEMVTGKVPYSNLSDIVAGIQIVKKKRIDFDPPQPLSTELSEFINYCLDPIPEKRASATQLLASRFIQILPE